MNAEKYLFKKFSTFFKESKNNIKQILDLTDSNLTNNIKYLK